MREKKKRGYVRMLERELKEAREHETIASLANSWLMSEVNEYRGLRNRIRLIQLSHVISKEYIDDIREVGLDPLEISKANMLKDLVMQDEFKDAVKVSTDPDFCGWGSKYVMSVKIVVPTFD